MKHFITVAVLSMALLSSRGFAENANYKIVIDAGSTGSRLHIFKYDATAVLPKIEQEYFAITKPGLSKLQDKSTQEVVDYVKNLVDPAIAHLKNQQINPQGIEINLMATAGMRLVAPDTQDKMYAAITSYLKTTPFVLGEVKTIPGEMEALYGWLDVNYQLGNFTDNKPTVGSIDMGGASTQFAYAIEGDEPKAFTVRVNNKSYKVASVSFLGLGEQESLKEMMKDPNAAACYPTNFPGNLHGPFNMQACTQIYKQLLQKYAIPEKIKNVNNQEVIAYSGIYNTFKFFDAITSPSTLATAIQTRCADGSWDAQIDLAYCAFGVYENELLFNQYKLQGAQLKVMNTIGADFIDWTLGAVLYKLANASANKSLGAPFKSTIEKPRSLHTHPQHTH